MHCNNNSFNEEPNKCLGELFFDRLTKYGDRTFQFIVDGDVEDKCKDVLERSVRSAIKLKEKGVKPGDIIALCSSNHINTCIPFIASQLIGAINANFDLNVSEDIAVYLLRTTEPNMIFVDGESAPKMEKYIRKAGIKCEIVAFNGNGNYVDFSEYVQPSVEEKEFVPYKANIRDTAVILFSSGTTGYPKGMCLHHYGLIKGIIGDRFYPISSIKPGKQPVFLVYTTLYWITAVAALIKSAYYGGAKVICSKFDPVLAWRVIDKYKVTNIFLTPHLAAEFATNRPDNVNVDSLVAFQIGGTKFSEKIMKDLNSALRGIPVVQIYGLTECSSAVASFIPTPENVKLQEKYPLSCGKIYDFLQWKVVDPNTEKVLGPNQKGELRLKSNTNINGYHKLESSLFDSDGYLKTGDVVYYNEDNCIFIVDRIKEMFKCRGIHIIPSVIEDVLLLHPAVKEAVVIGIPHDIDEHHPMGIVTLKEGKNATSEEIENFVKGKVFESQWLRAGIKIVQELPRNSNDKVVKSLIKTNILNGEL